MIGLQIAWFLLVGVLLTGYAVLDGYDLGVGVLHLFIAKTDHERRILLNSIGPLWDGNEVWLLTGGGALFAAFPRVYATVFSGFYIALMLVLLALIVRGVSIEFRSKEENGRWRTAWDVAFALGSFLPALLFGVAIGNIVRGVPLAADGEFAGTFLGLLNPFALLVGLLATAMFVVQGATWLMVRTTDQLRDRAATVAMRSWVAFVVLWIVVTIFARVEGPHLWRNYTNPWTWIAPVVFIWAAAALPLAIRRMASRTALALSSCAIAALMGILGQSLFPNMVPSLANPAMSLTIFNASSTLLTLKTMLIIALVGMPVVLAYSIWIHGKFMDVVVLDEHSY